MHRPIAHLARLAQLALGLFLYGAATALMVRAAVGVSSWSVLTEGLERIVPLSFGTLTLLVSLAILLLWVPLRQRPGIGTVCNVLVIGPSADLVLAHVSTPDRLEARIALFVIGLGLLAFATACYIGAGYGTGARDGLMVGLHERFGWPLWASRTVVEGVVVVAGGVLGGDIGVGTVIAAVAIGPILHPLMAGFRRLPWTPRACVVHA